ncbi:GAF and ANTAR domain-containing protein [Rhodococcus sp. X156]|uniref:GAF and ANTAR domain-containing protein n=1 Tax=Rhodococcus sp. X156 TaxID=2499145 RepID=UPI000FD98E5A|nr:GAF and ANTAR domain-containing protein [Rhodococcus sp. X156]
MAITNGSSATAARVDTRDPRAELTESVHALGRIVLDETPLADVVAQVATLAKECIPGAHEVSVTVLKGTRAATFASTGEVALRLDERQYSTGHGPCLVAATSGRTVLVADMRAETRWPDYTPRAVQAGVLSSVSVPLPLRGETVGGLNIYVTRTDVIDDFAMEVAKHFAGYAAVAITNAHLYATTAELAQQMDQAMESRAVIEQAKGIIMGERRCTEDEAFQILVQVSQDANRKLRDVAAALVAQAHPTG